MIVEGLGGFVGLTVPSLGRVQWLHPSREEALCRGAAQAGAGLAIRGRLGEQHRTGKRADPGPWSLDALVLRVS